MTAILREAGAADSGAVIALWEACGLTRPWNDPRADFDRALGFAGSTVLVTERDSRVIGSVMTGYDGHRGWIYYLGVHPDGQREGHARALIDAACDFLAAQGCPKVELMVRDGNPAQGLYERLDWELQPVRVWARWLHGKDC
ncbi:MAG: GNAT family acetyltransferase [Sphingomonadales bacterium]|nr:GNAT family acetyltransferase [Sphingomonadales bacterium]MDE2570109.1 GNAT family acetyltransferase [Sphingomonadales bacterium]